MKKLINFSKRKNYIYLSVTMLSLSLYIVFFPIFSKLLNYILPNFSKCVYKSITKKPCPLCGGTKFIAQIKDNIFNLSYFNCFFGYVIIFVIFEIIFRIFCILYIKNSKHIKALFITDVFIHVIVFVLFVLYEIIYIINT